jgi:hypothetical protein
MKTCTKCKEVKKPELFSKKANSKDGLRSQCKDCDKLYSLSREEYMKNYYSKNREKILSKSKEYFKENKDEIYKYKIKWTSENKEKLRQRHKERTEENPEKYRNKRREYYNKNKEEILNKSKQYAKKNIEATRKRKKDWAEKNKEKIKLQRKINYEKNREQILERQRKNRIKNREKRNKHERERIKNDPLYKFKNNTRKLISGTFSRNNISKPKKTEDILGCSVDFFREYIASMFKHGMSFENHSRDGWHLDHIIPISSATTEEDVIKLNHYTNFQPLWAKDNLSKHNKIIDRDEK